MSRTARYEYVHTRSARWLPETKTLATSLMGIHGKLGKMFFLLADFEASDAVGMKLPKRLRNYYMTHTTYLKYFKDKFAILRQWGGDTYIVKLSALEKVEDKPYVKFKTYGSVMRIGHNEIKTKAKE